VEKAREGLRVRGTYVERVCARTPQVGTRERSSSFHPFLFGAPSDGSKCACACTRVCCFIFPSVRFSSLALVFSRAHTADERQGKVRQERQETRVRAPSIVRLRLSFFFFSFFFSCARRASSKAHVKVHWRDSLPIILVTNSKLLCTYKFIYTYMRIRVLT
jgi:hypothetical protein